MPLTAHRRHAIASTLHTIGPILLYQHLLSPNITIFLIRLIAQTRISAPRLSHPTTSLLTLSLLLTLMHLLILFLHAVDNLDSEEKGGVGGGKGLVIDFIGIKHRPSLTFLLSLDLLIYLIQLLTLYTAYLADPLPITSADPLKGRVGGINTKTMVSSGRRRGRRRRVYRNFNEDVDAQADEVGAGGEGNETLFEYENGNGYGTDSSDREGGSGNGRMKNNNSNSAGLGLRMRSNGKGRRRSNLEIDLDLDDGDIVHLGEEADILGGRGEDERDALLSGGNNNNSSNNNRSKTPSPHPPLIFQIPTPLHLLHTILTYPHPESPTMEGRRSFVAGGTPLGEGSRSPLLGSGRGSGELGRVEEGLGLGLANGLGGRGSGDGEGEGRRMPGGIGGVG